MNELMNYSISDLSYSPELPSNYQSIFEFNTSLGDFSSNGITSHDQFTSTLDGNPVVRTYNNFTINSGHTVTSTLRCKGLYLNILGNLIVNGTLSMTARGANAGGQYIAIDKINKKIFYYNNFPNEFEHPNYTIINKVGGAAPLKLNALANNGINGACGSGGCGYVEYTSSLMGLGGAGTSFSGGAGGGAKVGRSSITSQNGSSSGGAGGKAAASDSGFPAGGGAGNPGGGSNLGSTGQSGTGGLIILFVHGNIIFGSNGVIQSNGSMGGSSYGSGGGSGGGTIHIFYNGTINILNKIIANGGPAGTGTGKGTAGGNGTINLVKL